MRILLWFIVMFTGSMLFGCDSAEQPKTQAPTAAQQPAQTEQTTKTEQVKVVTPVDDAAQAAAAQPEKRIEQTDKPAEAVVAETGKLTAATVEETAKAAETATTKPAQQTDIPREIVLQASYGNISFPHAMHAGSYACKVCHGDAAPAAFDITKDVAHKLCKDCHKQEGAGPTGCSGCHKK
jgi:hypothetical protein